MRKFEWVAPHLAEILLIIFGLALATFALYIIGPWFLNFLGSNSVVGAGVPERGLQLAVGLFFLVTSLVNLSIPAFRNPVKRLRVAKYAALGSFLSFVFLAFLRILVFGWIPLTWIYPVALALASGLIRLYLETKG